MKNAGMNFTFDGSISREVLNNYLARSVSHIGLGDVSEGPSTTFEEDLDMLIDTGAKFIGRASYIWSPKRDLFKLFGLVPELKSTQDEENANQDSVHFAFSAARAAAVHAKDPEIIMQGCVFECINKDHVNTTKIPKRVFAAFELPEEDRCFDYDKMLFPDGSYVNFWAPDCSVEDITRLETQMWIFYRSASYIDAGFEAIHFGQVYHIGKTDAKNGYRDWAKIINMVRDYAKVHARRHYVLCDAHVHGIEVDGIMLFDYNAYPIRLKEIINRPQECECEENYLDSLFGEGRSKGGTSPSGWKAESMPFIVEFDNFGKSGFEGKPDHESVFAWGYDEITWFARQPKAYRMRFLQYIYKWINDRYPEGHLQMPSRRCLCERIRYEHTPVERYNLKTLDNFETNEYCDIIFNEETGAYIINRLHYSANNPTDKVPFGSGEQSVIKYLWGNS